MWFTFICREVFQNNSSLLSNHAAAHVRERREFDSLNFNLDLCPPDMRPNARLSVLTVAVEAPLEMFTLYPGERLDLSCSASDSTQAVNWTKDHVLVVDGEHTRIRNGHLEIESVELSDSGLYACTTFGNHSGFFNISGILGKSGGGASRMWAAWSRMCLLCF